MQWSDRGIILSVRRLGESSGLIHLLTPHHGLVAGVDRGAFSKNKRGIYQPGNVVAAHWNARLPEHVGMIACELMEATAAQLLEHRHKLAALISATLLTQKMLAEREAQIEVYTRMEALLHALCADEDWRAEYVLLELTLLACTGYGLDLDRCAATGQAHDLAYVSPKSGRAVSRGAGAPYHDRLLALPPFLIVRAPATDKRNEVNIVQILDGLRLCGYFLGCRVFEPRGIPVPAARARFVKVLQSKESSVGEVVEQVG